MVLIPVNESEDLKATDKTIDNRFEFLKNFDLNLFPKTCKKEYLPHLAFLFDVDIRALSELETREILSRAITLKKYVGSVYYLEEMLKIFDKDCVIKEWFSYSGNPYHFKVEVANTNKIINEDFYLELEKNISKYKNVRSVLDSIDVKFKTDLQHKYASAIVSGENIKVYPYQPRVLKTSMLYRFGSVVKQREKVSIYLDGETV